MSNKVYVTVGVDRRNIPEGGEAGQFLVKASDDDYDFVWSDVSGTSAERQPSTGVSPKDAYNATKAGIRGTSVNYARQDHSHPLNVPTTGLPQKDGTAAIGDSDYYAAFNHVHPLNVDATTPEMDGAASAGSATTYARRDHVHPTDTAIVAMITPITPVDFTVSLATADWVTDGTYADKHTQTITIAGYTPTANTVVDLYPDYTVMHQMTEDGTSGLYVENNSGMLTAVAVGEKPTADLAVSARRIEV